MRIRSESAVCRDRENSVRIRVSSSVLYLIYGVRYDNEKFDVFYGILL